MKVMEGSKKSGLFSKDYSLAITCVISAENPIDSEIRHVNEAMINWFNSRRKSCKAMVLVYLAEPAFHEAIVTRTSDMLNQNFEYTAIIQQLKVELHLLDAVGKPVKSLEIGPKRG